jgi:hypothetical protein
MFGCLDVGMVVTQSRLNGSTDLGDILHEDYLSRVQADEVVGGS